MKDIFETLAAILVMVLFLGINLLAMACANMWWTSGVHDGPYAIIIAFTLIVDYIVVFNGIMNND